ncbi:UNVERIFIED_CONTAM: hypothetical protein Sradi_3837200 [Sesamum radiatum]|uniref:Reverse transcriptase zinc-binding domain-containing protein n=1 Tax=Sesamum radiatum TaxID=300843 RepID=A0AAW2Q1D2_SESRA
MEFFRTGRFLKQVNSTLISLIPKHLPPRCALKVDLQKAYDTVEWDFLSAVLTLFGFLLQFISWIEECVTTPSFSVCLNGSPHGFFREKPSYLISVGFRSSGYTPSYSGISGMSPSPPLFGVTSAGLQAGSNLSNPSSWHYRSKFILPKTVISEIEKRLRLFLWKGCASVGYAKVSWQQVCRPVTEGGLGIRDILALNRGLMSRHLCDRSGPWGWRKLVRLRVSLRPCITYRIGSGSSFCLWHDPWHDLGPLVLRFPLGPWHSATSSTAPLSIVIRDGSWHWPPITDMESIDITHFLPTIHGGPDRVIWTGPRDSFSSAVAYDVFHPPGPKVEWSSLLVGSLEIPRHRFILWLAILGRLSTLDKPWLQHLGTDCVLCRASTLEIHYHLFFSCPFAVDCLQEIRAMVIFHWPYSSWDTTIRWASAKWRGKHMVNASYKALLASLVYHLWEERNHRIFL